MDIMHTDMDEIAVIKINQRPSSHCIEPNKENKGLNHSKISKTYRLWCSRIGSCIYQLPLPRSYLQLNPKDSTCNGKEGIIPWDN